MKLPNVFCVVVVLVLAVVIGFSLEEHAYAKQDILRLNKPWPESDELDFLPRYCWARKQLQLVGYENLEDLEPGIRDEVIRWKEYLGEDVFLHVHHYCAGLNRLRRYWLSVERDGRTVGEDGRLTGKQAITLKQALRGLKYVRNYYRKAKSPLYVEDLYYTAVANWQLGDVRKAISDLMLVVKEKPDYAAAYITLSKIAEEAGNVKDAIEVVKLGIKNTGGDSSLRDRLKELEGNN